jgi:hypothetical protein
MTNQQSQADLSKSREEDRSGDGAPSPSKRNLLKVAWVAPAVLAVTLPRSGYAANVSGTHSERQKSTDGRPKDNNGKHFGWFKKGS